MPAPSGLCGAGLGRERKSIHRVSVGYLWTPMGANPLSKVKKQSRYTEKESTVDAPRRGPAFVRRAI